MDIQRSNSVEQGKTIVNLKIEYNNTKKEVKLEESQLTKSPYGGFTLSRLHLTSLCTDLFTLKQGVEPQFSYFNDASQQEEEFPIRLTFKKPMETVSSLKVGPGQMKKSNSSKNI